MLSKLLTSKPHAHARSLLATPGLSTFTQHHYHHKYTHVLRTSSMSSGLLP